jgi:heme oxygenase (mycobilin-producing)
MSAETSEGVRAAPAADAGQAVGFVALSRSTVANGMTAEVKRAFAERPRLVDGAPGFVRLDVLTPSDAPDEIWPVTIRRDEESFRVWHHSHLYRESHRGVPKGLKLVPRSARLRYFEYVSS